MDKPSAYVYIITWVVTIATLSVVHSAVAGNNIYGPEPPCCLGDQWEATFLTDAGLTSKVGLVAYINGTDNISYDYINQRKYVYRAWTMYTPVQPFPPSPQKITTIYDYKTVTNPCTNGTRMLARIHIHIHAFTRH
jgi:hypothetical protein